MIAELAGHPAPICFYSIPNQDEFLKPQAQNARRVRSILAQEAFRLPLPRTFFGLCSGCNRFVDLELSAMHANINTSTGAVNISYSETSVCPTCKINSRMRFAVDLLSTLKRADEAKIYCTEQGTYFYNCLTSQGLKVVGSEYLGSDKTPGQTYGEYRHEDLSGLSFGDGSFDSVVCLDVLEHVSDPIKAIFEMQRVLKAGGVGLVTFPFVPTLHVSRIRARNIGGTIQKYCSDVYHDAPHGAKSLVYTDFGWDFIEEVKKSLPDSVFVDYWSPIRGHHGPFRPALFLCKS